MVALRCGLVEGVDATLFAGCGIVADSDPAREWDESLIKLRAVANALGGMRGDDGSAATGTPGDRGSAAPAAGDAARATADAARGAR